ncbi:MAG: glycosyltransferase family 39 protein [Candidatus Paceibacterota bacterium]|jgi:4-amino-4-deoxy-L-arabinose transferase-like glycosyltransferase
MNNAPWLNRAHPFTGRAPLVVLGIIILLSASLMLNAAASDSAIMDELAHIPAGYSYVSQLDYRLNPEHPPLVKALAALPLLFAQVSLPTDIPAWQTAVNGQWDMGTAFLYQTNDHRADTIIFLARLFPILITLGLILLVYWWSRKLVGPLWALAPTFFTALSPNILAHGHYVTTDIGAALGFLATLYTLNAFWAVPSKKTLAIAGIVFGLAQLTKFSLVLMIPIAGFLALMHWRGTMRTNNMRLSEILSWRLLWKYLYSSTLIFIIGYAVVWGMYALVTARYPIERQVADTTFILNSFSGGSHGASFPSCITHPSMRCIADLDIWMAHTPGMRAMGQYLLGVLMVMQRSDGGNTAYFLGNLGGGGWWYYFPIVFLIKETLPALFYMAIGAWAALRRMSRTSMRPRMQRWWDYVARHFPEFSMATVIVVYWAYSMHSPLNIGFRHILPTVPLLYMLATISVKKWVVREDATSDEEPSLRTMWHTLKKIARMSAQGTLIAVLILWGCFETALASPHFLSYFNEMGGGTWNGYHLVTDSNYDWGQDLKALDAYVKQNNIQKIAVDYFGGGSPHYYLGDAVAISWNSPMGSPADHGIDWLAVSVNSIQSAKAHPLFDQAPANTYPWITDWDHPYARAGTSIFIYRLR